MMGRGVVGGQNLKTMTRVLIISHLAPATKTRLFCVHFFPFFFFYYFVFFYLRPEKITMLSFGTGFIFIYFFTTLFCVLPDCRYIITACYKAYYVCICFVRRRSLTLRRRRRFLFSGYSYSCITVYACNRFFFFAPRDGNFGTRQLTVTQYCNGPSYRRVVHRIGRCCSPHVITCSAGRIL